MLPYSQPVDMTAATFLRHHLLWCPAGSLRANSLPLPPYHACSGQCGTIILCMLGQSGGQLLGTPILPCPFRSVRVNISIVSSCPFGSMRGNTSVLPYFHARSGPCGPINRHCHPNRARSDQRGPVHRNCHPTMSIRASAGR